MEPINRKGFMAELRNLLAFMDEEDRQRVLRRYERMFDDAGEDGEEKLIRSLGSPVRQVLDVEREYRRDKALGKTPFLDADDPDSPERKDLSSLVREAADALKDPDSEKTLFPAAGGDELPKNIQQLPIEDLIPPEGESDILPETVIPDMDESPAVSLEEAEPAESGPEAPEAEASSEPGPEETEAPDEGLPTEEHPTEEAEASAPEPEEIPAGPAPEKAPAELLPEPTPQTELLTPIYDETEEAPAEPAKVPEVPTATAEEPEAAEDEAEEGRASPGFGRILAAIIVTLPFLLWWAAGFAVSLALGAIVLAVGFAFCVAGVYLGGYALSSVMTFMPDKLLVGGVALGCFAAALILIWTGLWIIVGGISLVIRTSGRIYRRILNIQDPEEEDE